MCEIASHFFILQTCREYCIPTSHHPQEQATYQAQNKTTKAKPPKVWPEAVGFQLNRANAKSLGDRSSVNSSLSVALQIGLFTPLRICPSLPILAERSSLWRGLAAALNGSKAGLFRCLILFCKLVLLRARSMCTLNWINKADRQFTESRLVDFLPFLKRAACVWSSLVVWKLG